MSSYSKLELTFQAEYGEASLYIKNPIKPVDPAQVKTSMDAIVTANVFNTTNGDLISPKSARVVDRTTQDVTLP